jgi:hypothetical protein
MPPSALCSVLAPMGNPMASKSGKVEKWNFLLHTTYPEILRANLPQKKKLEGKKF